MDDQEDTTLLAVVEGLIEEFTSRLNYWKSFGEDARAAGVYECIEHLYEYRRYLVTVDAAHPEGL